MSKEDSLAFHLQCSFSWLLSECCPAISRYCNFSMEDRIHKQNMLI